MASNAFGKLFRITTWGESHGKAIGVVIDGCPAGVPISDQEINDGLKARAPGNSPYTSPRKESDYVEIYSGVFEGVTTGAPLSIIIPNRDADSSKYEPIKHLLRPGHANYSYLQKYGVFDYRGGGRASARETACRVAAGVLAKKILRQFGIEPLAYIKSIGSCQASIDYETLDRQAILSSTLNCPDQLATVKMIQQIEEVMVAGDSIGGVVEVFVKNLPAGLGDPVYEKLEACLAKALMSIPATRGFEIGSGFAASAMRGSLHNDIFTQNDGRIDTKTNHAGGLLGGISMGTPLVARVAFKPPSSIAIAQETLDENGNKATFELPKGSRHDPCVAIRAVPVVEAMTALVLVDALLLNQVSRVENLSCLSSAK